VWVGGVWVGVCWCWGVWGVGVWGVGGCLFNLCKSHEVHGGVALSLQGNNSD